MQNTSWEPCNDFDECYAKLYDMYELKLDVNDKPENKEEWRTIKLIAGFRRDDNARLVFFGAYQVREDEKLLNQGHAMVSFKNDVSATWSCGFIGIPTPGEKWDRFIKDEDLQCIESLKKLKPEAAASIDRCCWYLSKTLRWRPYPAWLYRAVTWLRAKLGYR